MDENIGQVIDECLHIAQQAPNILDVRELFWKRFGGRVPTDSLEVVGESFAIFWITKGNPLQSIIGGSSLGRDVDCVASIAGAISGAYKGVSDIPTDWIDQCNKAMMNDPHELIDMSIKDMSEKLYNILLKIIKKRKEQIKILESMK